MRVVVQQRGEDIGTSHVANVVFREVKGAQARVELLSEIRLSDIQQNEVSKKHLDNIQ